MTDTIAPALTPDQWAGNGMDQPSILGELPYIADNDPINMARVMAKANDLLEPDSPYKITRADVTALTRAIRRFGDCQDGTWCLDLELAPLAAKLAALLPPE